jgi:hypothetical protein
MSKVLAFQTLRGSIQAAQAGAGDYKTALWSLISYAAQLKAYQFPTDVQHPPEGWDEAQKTWAGMTGTLSGWAYSTLAMVIKIPTELLQSSDLTILPSLRRAIDEAGLLVNNPNDTAAKKDLLEITLPALATKFREFSSWTTALVYRLENQATVFDQDAKTMQDIANIALKAAGTDADKIKQLTQEIQSLRDDFTSHAQSTAGEAIATSAVTMALLVLPSAPGTLSLLALMVPAVLITTGGKKIVATNTQRIVYDAEKIDDAINKIETLNAEITFLNTVASNLQQFASQVDGLKNALSVVAQPWQSAENYFTQAYNDLIDVEVKKEDWLLLRNELQEIENDWKALMPTMKQLLLDVEFSNAKLEIGMDENQVRQALDNRNSVDIIEYLAA